MGIEGKVALVTGGSGGLGSVHCLALGRAGYNVAVVAHSHPEKAEEVASQIRAMGRKSVALKMDVAKFDEVQAGVRQIEKELGPVQVLVSNAAFGIVRAITIVNMKNEDWERDVAVNLTGAFNMTKCCLPGMLERGWGRVIYISSITGTMGGFGQCSYAATKAGLIGLAKTVALEGARKGVTGNALVLGMIEGGAYFEVAPEFRERINKTMALRRPGKPQEVSNLIIFMASEESSYITGEAIEISGGAGLFTF
jgi:3-oxoacyl-[acyl-carrier protein] reductase